MKIFLTKIRPTVPLTEAPLVRLKRFDEREGRLISLMFSNRILLLFTPAIFYTDLLYPYITFLWHTHTFLCISIDFSPRLGPPYPSRRLHLSGQKVWRKGGGNWFRQYFPPESYYFLHQQFPIPTSYTHILLSFSTHILFFEYSLTHNSRPFLFWKDNNWHHCLWKENKDVY